MRPGGQATLHTLPVTLASIPASTLQSRIAAAIPISRLLFLIPSLLLLLLLFISFHKEQKKNLLFIIIIIIECVNYSVFSCIFFSRSIYIYIFMVYYTGLQ